MKLKKTTWILVITAFLMMGWVAISELTRPGQEENKIAEQKIFNVEQSQIQKIIINQKDLTLEFIQTADQESSWSMVQPEQALIDDAAIAFLTDLLVSGTSDRIIASGGTALAEYGLDKPIATISFATTEGQTSKIALGQPTIDNSLIYAQVFSDTQINNKIVLVAKTWQYAVERDFQEWKRKS